MTRFRSIQEATAESTRMFNDRAGYSHRRLIYAYCLKTIRRQLLERTIDQTVNLPSKY